MMAIYILKTNVMLILLYGFYRLMMKQDTFFNYRRFILLALIAVSIFVPFLDLTGLLQENTTAESIAGTYASFITPVIPVYASSAALTWKDIVCGVYLFGVAILAIRFLWQLVSIFSLVRRTPSQKMEGTLIHILPEGESPFSFMQWIFVNPDAQTSEQLHEILVHERTHARQWHSVDILLSEMFCIFCWFNPFSWLMKREIRLNLEYLADESVLDKGTARKSYQYHLLGLAYHPTKDNLTNQFNVLQLKNRIKMMNKHRTNERGKAKYLLFIPLIVAMLAVSNIESIARTGKDSELNLNLQETHHQVMSSKEPTKIYDYCDRMPVYPGGINSMMAFLCKNVKYPKACQKAGLQGEVLVQFVVEEDGSVSHVKVVRPVNKAFDAEALRVVNLLPRWQPGYEHGKAVRVKYDIPISFRLH
ncbi:MAG: M56 family metallopeptidase [Prevotella sp.]|jgi:TonB family protein|nr:M56 family metallopeptidase [Prevotella sp.]